MLAPPDQSPDDPQQAPWWKRLAWMVAIWALSVTFLGAVAMVIRYWLKV